MSDKATCRILSPSNAFEGRQGFSYLEGITAESVGARGLCMNYLSIPPGHRSNAHMHENHETAIYVISGEVRMWWGDNLENDQVIQGGEFVYIPAGVPHLTVNISETEPCVAVLARTDPNEQESVKVLPELEKLIGID